MLADLHTHTNTSHGHHSAAEMYEGAAAAGLDLFGLSEHSPLPEEYACKLYVAAFPGNFRQFVQDVQALRQRELEREDRPSRWRVPTPGPTAGRPPMPATGNIMKRWRAWRPRRCARCREPAPIRRWGRR